MLDVLEVAALVVLVLGLDDPVGLPDDLPVVLLAQVWLQLPGPAGWVEGQRGLAALDEDRLRLLQDLGLEFSVHDFCHVCAD